MLTIYKRLQLCLSCCKAQCKNDWLIKLKKKPKADLFIHIYDKAHPKKTCNQTKLRKRNKK